MTRTSGARHDSEFPVTSTAELHGRLIDSIADCSVVALDLNGGVLTWNAGAQRIAGYTSGEIVGRSFSVLYPPDDVVAGIPQHDLADAERVGRTERDAWRVARDGAWVRVHVALAALRNDAGDTIGFGETARPLAEVTLPDAERALRTREEMLAIVAHDLRNPMHAIMAAASMLALQAPDDQHRRRIAVIQRSAKEMERLVTDLLDVARVESGHLVIRHEPIDILALLDETVEGFHVQATAIGITLVCEVGDGIRTVAGDRDRVVQVLSNLIANALKFTPPGGRVSVRASGAEAQLVVSVKDSGDGIPAEDLPRVFDRFWRADRGSMAGAGLGLAICKSIVEAHGGRIWAASAVGRGTTFHFTLPYAST
jgi:PAS domain S-box-containing protein